MKQEKQYIEELLRKFLEGQTSESEEQTLSDYFCSAKDIPAEWQKYKEMFQSFKTDAYDFSEEEIDAMLAPAVEKKTKVVRIWPWAAAACVVVAIGIFVTLMTHYDQAEQNTIAEAEKSQVTNPVVEPKPIAQVVPEEKNTDTNIEQEHNGDNNEAIGTHHEEKLVAEAPRKKHQSERINRTSEQQVPVEETQQTTISTTELLETIDLLADIGTGDATITVSPHGRGFIVNTVSTDGEANSYMLRRCSDGDEIELTSRIINF